MPELGVPGLNGGHVRGEGTVISRGCCRQVWFDTTWSDLGLAMKGTLGDCMEDEA